MASQDPPQFRPPNTPLPAPNDPSQFSSSPAFATPAVPRPPIAKSAGAGVASTASTTARRPSIEPPADLGSSSPLPRDASSPAPPKPSIRKPSAPPVLPILLPPATLRPIAFRTFTKKHNLTLTSAALAQLAQFVGRHCGSGWRDEGLAEGLLEEVTRLWKRGDGRVIVDTSAEVGADKDRLKGILKGLEGCMVGGRVSVGGATPGAKTTLNRQSSLLEGVLGGAGRPGMERNESQDTLGMSGLDVDQEMDDEEEPAVTKDPRNWLKVVGAFDQPRLVFNPERKQFEKSKSKASFFPPPSQKTELFRQRYHLIHQRLLRNESFQPPTTTTNTSHTNRQSAHQSQNWKITPIANLLGRSGSGHLLLGLLTIAPTGTLALSDLTGSIRLDITQASPIDEFETWLCPGMMVLVDGIYEEEYNPAGGSLEGVGGVGGAIGGRFIGFSIGAPRCETRAACLGLTEGVDGANAASAGAAVSSIGGGFGWVDFLGVGSERAIGTRMRRLEQRILRTPLSRPRSAGSDGVGDSHATTQQRLESTGRNKLIFAGPCHLDNPTTLTALRRIFTHYTSAATAPTSRDLPLSFTLFGPFITHAALSTPLSHSSNSANSTSSTGTDTSSIAYKEAFDALAALLTGFPALLRNSHFIFVPGDSDPWVSAGGAGAACPLPRKEVPDMFTGRVRRAFAAANADAGGRAGGGGGAGAGAAGKEKEARIPGQPIFTTNPSRLSLFGPSQEIVLFRDDISSRLRRNSITLPKRTTAQPSTQQPTSTNTTSTSTTTATDAEHDTQHDTDHNIDTDTDTDMPDAPSHQPRTPQTSQNQQPNATLTSARRTTKTLLDQSYLAPFTLNIRPVHWSFGTAPLTLYPTPSAVVVCDGDLGADGAWGVRYQGVWVGGVGGVVGVGGGGAASGEGGKNSHRSGGINASMRDDTGPTTTRVGAGIDEAAELSKDSTSAAAGAKTKAAAGTSGKARYHAKWLEYDVATRRGRVMEIPL
ncbi:MAG: DNA-directed DNA polymerase epsilon, subunit B [Alyxoria varia]|nr:MAG: DNA-directed DNA polymerase epsilon, subunit B [Alyxoria varia]